MTIWLSFSYIYWVKISYSQVQKIMSQYWTKSGAKLFFIQVGKAYYFCLNGFLKEKDYKIVIVFTIVVATCRHVHDPSSPRAPYNN